MTNIKVAEACGPALDWMVAKCEGEIAHFQFSPLASSKHYFAPSKKWAQGGPIIEREKIGTWPAEREDKIGLWGARMLNTYICYGPTPLIAAMRCYVVSKLGDEVDVPDQLLE